MIATKTFTLIHKDTLKVISHLIEVSNNDWHKMVNGELVEKLSKEEVYRLIYCSKNDQFYICGS